MRIRLSLIGGSSVLAGGINGQVAFGRLLEAVPTPSAPTTVFLDFREIEVATASYLRESVLTFRELVRGRRSYIYPVVANANDTVTDELDELMRSRGDVLLACDLDANDRVHDPRMIGELDPKQKLTFDLVRRHGETDAGELMRTYGEAEGTRHTTAWNNRLAALTARGLLVEISQGRAKRYRPLFGEV